MHLRYLYPKTIINNWYLAGPSSLIECIFKPFTESRKYDWNMAGQSAKCGNIMSALVCDTCPFRCATYRMLHWNFRDVCCRTARSFALLMKSTRHWKKKTSPKVVKKNVSTVLNNRKYGIGEKYSSDRFGAGQEENTQTHFLTL